jgi:hypothetical protein
MRRRTAALLAVLTLLTVLSPAARGQEAAAPERRPILFVHGFSGSGGQFAAQKLRFVSNGYPESWIDVVDYNSAANIANSDVVEAAIDAKVAALLARTGADKVDLLGHSQGTFVSRSWMTDPVRGAARRALVAHYVNIDGQAENPGVDTLALWAGVPIGESAEEPRPVMQGAKNVTIPGQPHVEVATSREAFEEMYRFFTGTAPEHGVTSVEGPVRIAGKAVAFPANTGLAPSTVAVWPVDERGTRLTTEPVASFEVTDGSQGGGDWGPATVETGRRYEISLSRPRLATRHFYFEPFVRDDLTLRLNVSDPIGAYAGNRPGTMTVTSIRNKETRGDLGDGRDVLSVDGVEVCTPALCPTSKNVSAFYALDVDRDGRTTPGLGDPVISRLAFLSSADVAVTTGAGSPKTARWTLRSRGSATERALEVPRWDSATDVVSLQWNDYEPEEVVPAPAPSAPATPAAQAAAAPATLGRTDAVATVQAVAARALPATGPTALAGLAGLVLGAGAAGLVRLRRLA